MKDHIQAYNCLKHLESLSLPGASELNMGFHPPRCGNAYFSHPGLREKVQKQGRETIERLMDGFNAKVIMEKGSTLSEIVIGPKYWGSQTLWEKGKNGKLYRSKTIERSRDTYKITKVAKIDE